jgi:uncharacterized FlaG/YvyC family protein
MNIPLDPVTTQTPAREPSASATPAAPRLNRGAVSPEPKTNNEPPVTSRETSGLQQNVTFRRDSNGRIYYVISDAQSGEEIQEVPAKEVRSVNEAIDEYLSQEKPKAHRPLNTKA